MRQFAGVWRRTQLFEPKGVLTHHEDPSARLVLWLQTSRGIFVDIRLDRPQVTISTSKSFAGHISFNSVLSHITWTRVIDYRPLSPPDVGSVSFLSKNVLQEDGVLEGDDFTEIWEREEIVEQCVAVELAGLLASSGRRGYFVVVGDWFALSVSRHAPMDRDTARTMASSFDKPLESDPMKDLMLRHVTVAGRCSDSWSIAHSLDPSLQGRCLLDAVGPIAEIFANFDWLVTEGAIPNDIRDCICRGVL